MNLWSVSIIIEDQFKNLYSEFVEDFNGYVSSSLFLQENSNAQKKKSTLKKKRKKNTTKYVLRRVP